MLLTAKHIRGKRWHRFAVILLPNTNKLSMCVMHSPSLVGLNRLPNVTKKLFQIQKIARIESKKLYSMDKCGTHPSSPYLEVFQQKNYKFLSNLLSSESLRP